MRNLPLIIIIFFSGITLKAQTNLDSLYAVWEDESQTDSNRVDAYRNYIWNGFLFSNPDTTLILVQKLFQFSDAKSYEKAKAVAFNLMGCSYYISSKFPKALDYFQRSIKIYKDLGYEKGYADGTNNIGLIYEAQGDARKALEYYQQSLKIFEEIGEKVGHAKTLHNIGGIYNTLGEYDKALDYYQRSLKIAEEIGNIRGSASTISTIGNIYNNLGEKDKALNYYHRSLKICEELGDKQCISINTFSIGHIYKMQGKYPLALQYCQNSLKISELIGALAQEKEACQCLYDTYKAMGMGNNALIYLEKIQLINDSLYTEETTKKLQQMEFDKQVYVDSLEQVEEARLIQEAHEEEVSENKKTRNLLISGGLFALLLAGGFYSRSRYIKKSRDIISKEKDRSENLLLNILPEEIAQELKEKGKADARNFDMVSILFTDFKGFTEVSEKLSAQDLVSEINICFEAFDGIMSKYGIEKIKTIGDAYMAAGGLPVPKNDSVKKTTLAALKMQDFICQRKAIRDSEGKPAFEMRVGIHTGPVVAGIVGVKKFQYDIWGDTVNTASRIESNGQVGKVNISQSTYELLKDDADFTFDSRGKVEAKGKGEIEMYFVSKN